MVILRLGFDNAPFFYFRLKAYFQFVNLLFFFFVMVSTKEVDKQ